jgi:non-heme chloroperoxidase
MTSPRAFHVRQVELSNGVTLQYVEQGDAAGTPLILLHAIADSWRAFELVLPHLPASIHAFAVTQRGHGDASRPAEGYRPEDFAGDLSLFMDARRIDTAVVAGGSSGGFIARRFAIDHRARTLGLALLGSPATLRDKAGVIEAWQSTFSTLADPIDEGFVREFAESTLGGRVPLAFIDATVEENSKVPAYVWKATFEGLMNDNSLDELHKIAVPTLIVWGDQDEFLPRDDQEALKSVIAGSQLVTYAGAGHAVYCEEPGRIASDLADFVRKLAA